MNPLRVGVIGVGHLGALHVRMLKDLPGAHLAGIYDASPERLAKMAAEHGVPITFGSDAHAPGEVGAVVLADA